KQMWNDRLAAAYRDLIAWRKASDPALEIYRATQKSPKDELWALPPKCDEQPYRFRAISQRAKDATPARNLRSSCIALGFPARTGNPIVHSKRTALSRTASYSGE